MKNFLFDDIDRVTGRAVVTGNTKYAAEHELNNITYGIRKLPVTPDKVI